MGVMKIKSMRFVFQCILLFEAVDDDMALTFTIPELYRMTEIIIASFKKHIKDKQVQKNDIINTLKLILSFCPTHTPQGMSFIHI